jgi:hypothetical protein
VPRQGADLLQRNRQLTERQVMHDFWLIVPVMIALVYCAACFALVIAYWLSEEE